MSVYSSATCEKDKKNTNKARIIKPTTYVSPLWKEDAYDFSRLKVNNFMGNHEGKNTNKARMIRFCVVSNGIGAKYIWNVTILLLKLNFNKKSLFNLMFNKAIFRITFYSHSSVLLKVSRETIRLFSLSKTGLLNPFFDYFCISE